MPSCALGNNPAYWLANPADNSTIFQNIFGVTPTLTSSTGSNTTTFKQVLTDSITSLDAYLVAAYWDATPGSGYLLTQSQVIGMVSGNPAFSLPPGILLYWLFYNPP